MGSQTTPSTLAVLLTHLAPDAVDASLANLRAGMPGARLAVYHGGRHEDFKAITGVPKLFTEDPGLRGAPATAQSYNDVLAGIWHSWALPEPGVQHVALLEFDQVLLSSDFGRRLDAAVAASGADLLGKGCGDRTGTNWWHRMRFHRDPALLSFLRGLSTRDDPTRIFGFLGTGFVISRAALEGFCAVDHLPGIYNELYVPTVLHHLGFELRDVDRCSDLYASVRWTPPYGLAEVQSLQARGAAVAHPFKTIGDVPALTAAMTRRR